MKKRILIAIPVLLVLFGFLFGQTGRPVRLWDTNSSNLMTLKWNENDTSNRTLNITVNGANRTFALHGNLTVESASLINQDVTTDFSPTWVTAKLTGLTDGYVPYHVADATGLANSSLWTNGTGMVIGSTSLTGDFDVVAINGEAAVNIIGYDEADLAPVLLFRKSHSESEALVDTVDTELIGRIAFRGVDSGQNWDYGVLIEAKQDGAVGVRVPTNLLFHTYSSTAKNTNQLVLHHDGGVGINTATIPHGGVGTADFAIDSANPSFQLTQTTDDYPLFGYAGFSHDSMALFFDAYYDAGWKSSDAGSNFRILKSNDLFEIAYDSGIAQGAAVIFNDGIVLNTSGYVGLGGAASATGAVMITQNSDTLTITGDGTDWHTKWSDGKYILQSNETNQPTTVELKPNGTSEVANLILYDTGAERLNFATAADRGYIRSQGGALGINADAAQNVAFFESAAVGENPSVIFTGYNTAGVDTETTSLIMSDANDEFLIQAANSANHEGITVGLQETNQQLRIRQNSDVFGIRLDGSDTLYNTSDGVHKFAQALEVTPTVYGTSTITAGAGIGTATSVTTGMFISQDGGEDDNAFQIKNSDVTHADSSDGTNTFLNIKKIVAANGGALLRGITETVAGIAINGVATNDDTNKADTASAPVELWGSKIVGTSPGSVGADGNLVVIRNNSGANTARWLVDEDGDTWQSGSVTLGDEDNAEYIEIKALGGNGYIELFGAAVGSLLIQQDGNDDVAFFSGVDTGETPVVQISGYETGVGTKIIKLEVNNAGDGVITVNNDLLLAGIPTTDAGDYDLRYDAADGVVYDTSDVRQKSDIQPLAYGLNEIMQLKPKRYFYNRAEVTTEGFEITDRGNYTIGFIAQEVYQVIPDAVYKPKDESKHLWGLNEDKLTPVIINAIQEQQAHIESLEARIEYLENLILSGGK